MPRYFFNVHGESVATPDLVGRKLSGDEAARTEGKVVADDVAKATVESALLPDNQWVEVLDGDLRPVAVLPVSESARDPSRTE